MSGAENEKQEASDAEADGHAEAQRAAASLKDQIARLRARVQDAQDTLREHERRRREPRTFRR